MISREKAAHIAVYLIVGCIYAYALSLSVLQSTVLEFSYVGLFFVNSGFLLLFAIMFFSGNTALVFEVVLALGFLFIFPALKNFKPEGKGLVHDMVMRITDIYWFVRGYLPYDESYTMPILVFVSFLVCLITAIGLYMTFSFVFLSLIGFSMFVANWVAGYPRSDISFVLFLLCFIVFMTKRMNLFLLKETRGEKTTKPHNSLSTLRLLPLCILTILAASFMPNPGKSYEVGDLEASLNKPLTAVAEYLYVLFNPTYFSFQSTGFAGKGGRLGGRVTVNNRSIMRVKADERLYLTGAIYDDYTGKSWENTGGDFVEEQQTSDIDYLETVSRLYDIRRRGTGYVVLAPWFRSESLAEREIVIEIGSARTSTVFQTQKMYELQMPADEGYPLVNENRSMKAANIMKKNASYSMKYFSLNSVNKDYLERVQRNSGAGRDLLRSTYNSVSNEYFVTQAPEVIERYKTLPDSLPERVVELAKSITDGYDNEYDKAKAIENYLIKFPYTLSPEDVPRDSDFVDYFLFEGKEGYCTYYATAMAVLSRAVGIPSRYVEGYVLPAYMADDGYYYVTNRNAHSWAEIYIEGFGWSLFEATAPYNYALFNPDAAPEGPVFSQNMTMTKDYEDYMNEIGYFDEWLPQLQAGMENAPNNAVAGGEQEHSDGFWQAVFRIAAPVAIIALFYLLLPFLYRLYAVWEQRRIARMTNAEQVEIYFSRILKMCGFHFRYIKKQKFETPIVYAKRLGRRFAFRNDSLCMKDIVDVVYKCRYSGTEISADETAVLQEGYFALLEQLKSRHSRLALALKMIF